MRIQIEPTKHILDVDGVRCRLWQGVTETGVSCVICVHRIIVETDADPFAAGELLEVASRCECG